MSELDAFKARFQRLAELREERDITKTAAEKAEKDYRSLEAELYSELEEAGIRGRLEFDFGGDLGVIKFERASTNYGRVIDRDTAVAALKERGLGEIIFKEAIAEGRLNEYVRDCLESGVELADGTDYYTRKRIRISRK